MTSTGKNWLYLLALVTVFLLTGCAIENPEDAKKFLYDFQGQKFRQVKYRSLENNNLYRIHSGVRTILFDPALYTSTFQNYMEFSLTPCYGSVSGTYSTMAKDAFLEAVNGAGVDSTDSNNDGVYDIFAPYGPAEPPAATPEDRVDLKEYFFVIDINSNGVTPGCPITTDTKLYYQFLFYQNGDLILRDYNREIEFFFRPFE